MVPFHKILVPLDGSELAEKALEPAARVAAALAERSGQEHVHLMLLRAVSPVALVAADPMLYDELSRMGSDEAQAYLNTVAQTFASGARAGKAIVETETALGSPADAIVHFAGENDIDLIVMSSHGRTGSSRWVYGSVAEKVLHHAACATIVIRAHVAVPMLAKRKFLVPLDGSPLAERALAPALALAEAVDAEVTLLRVTTGREPMPESLSPSGREVGAALDDAAERERVEAEAYLQQVYHGYPNKHLFFDVVTAEGDIASTIVAYADVHQIDLIAMSSHGRSGIGRWLHGSVAEKVLRGADCATLVIRGSRS